MKLLKLVQDFSYSEQHKSEQEVKHITLFLNEYWWHKLFEEVMANTINLHPAYNKIWSSEGGNDYTFRDMGVSFTIRKYPQVLITEQDYTYSFYHFLYDNL